MSLKVHAVGKSSNAMGRPKILGEVQPQFRRLDNGNKQLCTGSVRRINNLLTVIGGQTELLLEKMPSGSYLSARLGTILSACRRAAYVLNSCESSGDSPLAAPQPVDLNAVVRRGADALRRVFEGQNVRFECELQEGHLPILLDARQLEHLLMNLVRPLQNELLADGSVVVTTATASGTALPSETAEYERAAGYAVLAVSFEIGRAAEKTGDRSCPAPYVQPDRGRIEGGLFEICRLLQNHDGFVTGEAVQGSGAKFRVYLPLCDGVWSA